jgi:endonuclease/exonuclease/phosphatase family metal-dependent hydrolase
MNGSINGSTDRPTNGSPIVEPAWGRDAGTPSEVRVMTFNVRYGTAKDGPGLSWQDRRPRVVATIRAYAPHVLGTQEVLAFQRDDLAADLPEYRIIAAGRDDGRETGEMSAIFYDASRLARVDAGHFWLSETPDVPGSVGWDAALTRLATWALLDDGPRGRLLVINAHFDHEGERARLESAKLIRERAAALAPPDAAVVVFGDFNAPADGAVHRALRGLDDERDTAAWIDVFDAVGTEPGATFNGFREPRRVSPDARIDWILASSPLAVVDARVDRSRPGGRFASDHFAVVARLAWR